MVMPAHVAPADVQALRSQLAVGIGSLCAHCRAGGADVRSVAELVADWKAWAAAPLDWLSAPALLQYGLELERDLATLQGPRGPRAVRYNTGPIAGADAPAPASPPTHGIVTPGDVLAYRALWDDYVTGTARAAATCAQAWQAAAAAASATPPVPSGQNINLSQFGPNPPDASTLQLWAESEQANSDAIMLRWNAHANTPDYVIIQNAGSILQDFQDAVLKVGQFYQPLIARDCPALPLPMPPAADAQTQIIARAEGLGIVAHGLLQLLGIGAGGALDTLGAIGQAAADTVKTIASPLPWIMLGVAGVGALALAARR